jgi:aldehyde dehydrogenase (NAD+)
MTAALGAELYAEAGFPPGVYNLIHGMGATGKQLVQDNRVDVILFTGSAEVGQEIRLHCASTWHKTCSVECGSKSAVILFKDGNLDMALKAMVNSAFKLSGQRCVSSSRVLIQRDLLDTFLPKLIQEIEKIQVGDPYAKPAPFCGPIISSQQMERVLSYNKMTENDPSVKVLLQGKRQGTEGYFLTPHVYLTEWGNKKFLKEEVFGPHLAVIPFDSVDDAIHIYNDTDYGLALGVITEDFRIMKKCRDECNCGMLYLNGGSVAAESHAPFGGVGKSGNGYKSAAGTYKAVTEEVAVTMNYEQGISWAQGLK